MNFFLRRAFFFILGQSLPKNLTFLFLRFVVVIYNRYYGAILELLKRAIMELPTSNRKKVNNI